MRPTSRPSFDGVLFFPVTPFTETGDIDVDALADHIANGIAAGPGGVFVACGTGEFHALDDQEFSTVVRTAVDVVAGRVPVYAGAGGSVAQAKRFATAAEQVGADGLLLDAFRMAEASEVSIAIDSAACPVVDPERRMECLTWGDDYQLLFTLPDGVEPPVAATRIGKVEPRGFAPLFVDGEPVTNREGLGYVHK